ncbi:MAG TPA: hypothetical protein PLK46_00470 [Propioniciclava sp.]|uniref:hypothetical protein n=1 Tax=Propioniciclava sp. TaxID=2038686 RepID=UPI002C5F1BA7|nr:hypothetical protein [Propioniciclava sp.]HRL50358.1 hypothetical protein [Propioniciclava sp.]HRL78785.1 hypothetical protein [Propioniciclava sp.]
MIKASTGWIIGGVTSLSVLIGAGAYLWSVRPLPDGSYTCTYHGVRLPYPPDVAVVGGVVVVTPNPHPEGAFTDAAGIERTDTDVFKATFRTDTSIRGTQLTCTLAR